MKKYFATVVWIIAVIFFSSSCKKNVIPGVCITSPLVDTAYVGQALTFSTCSNGEALYVWDFGDGSIDSLTQSSGLSTVHSYGAAGTYTGSLTIFNGSGASSKRPFTLHVFSGGTWTINGVSYPAAYYAAPTTSQIYPDLFTHLYAVVSTDSMDLIALTFYDSSASLTDRTYIPIGNGYLDAYNSSSKAQSLSGKVSIEVYHDYGYYYPTADLNTNNGTPVSIINGQTSITTSGLNMINSSTNEYFTLNVNLTQYP